MGSLSLKIAATKRNGVESFEGTVNLTGLRPTKLVRQSDESTLFPSRSAVLTSARSLASRLGLSGVEEVGAKKAAKTAAKTVTKAKTAKVSKAAKVVQTVTSTN